jgi:phosphinothricin acetyltransferase
MIVRAAADDDAEALAAIYGHHVLHGFGTFEEIAPSAAEMAQRRRAVAEKGLPYLVAEDAGRVLGFAYAAPFRPRAAYRYTAEDSVYVAPDALRRGVGRTVLSAVLDACASKGYRQMLALIGDSGNAGSIGLHEALGFAHVGTMRDVGHKAGRWVDVVVMQKALG